MVNRIVAALSAVLMTQGLAMALSSGATAQAPPPVAAQTVFPNPIITLPPASLNDFDTVLPLIAHQAKVALVCEGQPLHLTLFPKALSVLAHHLDPAGMPLEETVRQVAAAYDYDALRLSADTFLLTKRYTDKDDLPDVTFEEARTSLQNILDATQKYRPATGPEATLLDFIRSTTPEQRAQLAQGVPVSQLPTEQQQTAWQFVCGDKFHSLAFLDLTGRRLKACEQRDTIFCYRRYLNLTYTAYEGAFAPHGQRDVFALSSWVDTSTGGGTGVDGAPGIDVSGPKIIIAPGLKDPTDPDGPALLITPSKLRLTLADLAKQLNLRPPVGGVSAAPVRVESALSHKVFCLVGGEFASQDHLIQAVCAMYGLERHDGYTINMVTIAMPRPKVLDETGAIKAEVNRLLPAAFRRAVQAKAGQDTSSHAMGSDYSTARGDALYITSVRRLRGIIEPLLSKSPKRQIPVPDASDEARDLVALSSLAKSLPDIQSLALPAALYLDNFDRTTFTLAQNGGDPNSFVYGFVFQGGDGQRGGMIGSMGYPQGTFGYGTGTESHMKFKIGGLTVGM